MLRFDRFSALILLLFFSYSTFGRAAENPLFSLFKEPLHRYSSINPSGNVVVKLSNHESHNIIHFEHTSNSNVIASLNSKIFGGSDTYVREIAWVDNDSVFISITKTDKAVASISDSSRLTSNFVVSFKLNQGNSELDIRQVKTRGFLVDSLPEKDSKILFSRNAIISKVYEINVNSLLALNTKFSRLQKIDGGEFVNKNLKAEIDGEAIRWLTNSHGDTIAVVYLTKEALVFSSRDSANDKWREIRKWDKSSIENNDINPVIPISLGLKHTQYYAIINNEEKQESLVLYDFADSSSVDVFQKDGSEILSLIFDASGDKLLSLIYVEKGNIKTHFFNADLGRSNLKLSKTFPSQFVRPVNMNLDGSRIIVKVMSATNPGDEYIVDQFGKVIRKLTTLRPWLSRESLATQHAKNIRVNDLDIEYVLTKKQGKKKYPLLVMPHGGPFEVTDFKFYNATTQFFAAKGFAVLQVNFRGSGGYGTQFRDKGKGEFGGKILEDIEASVTDVMTNSYIDSKRVCVYGASYGGYAAMMLPIRSPALYSCSVAFAGISDLSLLNYSSKRAHHARYREFLKEYIGDFESDYEYIKSISPLYNFDKLSIPFMLIHGAQDNVVDVEHAYRMKMAFDTKNKPIDFRILEGVGHGFKTAEESVQFYEDLLVFMQKHL